MVTAYGVEWREVGTGQVEVTARSHMMMWTKRRELASQPSLPSHPPSSVHSSRRLL